MPEAKKCHTAAKVSRVSSDTRFSKDLKASRQKPEAEGDTVCGALSCVIRRLESAQASFRQDTCLHDAQYINSVVVGDPTHLHRYLA